MSDVRCLICDVGALAAQVEDVYVRDGRRSRLDVARARGAWVPAKSKTLVWPTRTSTSGDSIQYFTH